MMTRVTTVVQRATVFAVGVVLVACGSTDDPSGELGGDAAGTIDPSPEPATTADDPRPEQPEFTIVATGDVLLHPPLWEQARDDAEQTGNEPEDFGPQLAAVVPIVGGADLSLCHLEVPIAPDGGPYEGFPQFSGPPQIAPALADTGYTACSVASNHIFDQGADGVERTLDALDEAGLAHAGAARTEAEAAEPTLVEVATTAGPVTVGLISYTFSFNGIDYPFGEAWRSNRIEETCVRDAMCSWAANDILAEAAEARSAGADFVITSLHWGDEYEHEPNATQLELAPTLIDSPDVDLVLGHHAHWVQPVENFDGQWVVYGLGNLMAAHETVGQELREGLLVRFTVAEDSESGEFATTGAEYLPLYQTYDEPRMVVDVRAALDGGESGTESQQRLEVAFDRTTDVVGSRGAFDDGMQLLDVP